MYHDPVLGRKTLIWADTTSTPAKTSSVTAADNNISFFILPSYPKVNLMSIKINDRKHKQVLYGYRQKKKKLEPMMAEVVNMNFIRQVMTRYRLAENYLKRFHNPV
jgi:hypothetical protein